jgi:hypothetical protein
VADRVMRMPDPGPQVSASPAQVNRKCATCEKDDKQTLRAKADGTQFRQGGTEGKPQANGLSRAAADSGEAPPIVQDVLSRSGQPLDSATRAFFEPRFGQDFNDVRVYEEAIADSGQVKSVGTTRPTPLPLRVGAKQSTCSGPSWRR